MEPRQFVTKNIELKVDGKLFAKGNTLSLHVLSNPGNSGTYFLTIWLDNKSKNTNHEIFEHIAAGGKRCDSKIKGLYSIKFKPRSKSIIFKYHDSFRNPILGKYVYYYQTYEVFFKKESEWTRAVRYLTPFFRKKPKSNSKFLIPRKTVRSL